MNANDYDTNDNSDNGPMVLLVVMIVTTIIAWRVWPWPWLRPRAELLEAKLGMAHQARAQVRAPVTPRKLCVPLSWRN